MLAHITNQLCRLLVVVALFVATNAASAQQAPSQRFQPTPPNAHVPPSETTALYQRQSGQKFHQTRFQRAAELERTQHSSRGAQRSMDSAADQIRQTGFAEPVRDARVPQILAGSSSLRQETAVPETDASKFKMKSSTIRSMPSGINQFAARATNDFKVPTNIPNAAAEPAQSESASELKTVAPPKVDPAELRRQQAMIEDQLQRLRAQMQDAKASVADANVHAKQPVSTPVDHPGYPDQIDAKPVETIAAEMEEPVNEVRQVANDVDIQSRPDAPRPQLTMQAPSIRVEAFGPGTIGINKTATYKVIVNNLGRQTAERIVVGIDLPEWVEIQNVNITTGTREVTDGADQARLIWSVDRVSSNSSQTITVNAIPRRAEMFDMGVEWAYLPRNASTSITVTEPRLEMNITGPREVMYGEKEIYHVAVRNPGTGEAENVNVMLPEALGGERAPLGNIPAGKEKNFQVELLARTAGQLDLIATASADGDLKVSANREITVRRANLEIKIDGPPMKYAGSIGQYLINIRNNGDAIANDVVAAIAMPSGAKYIGGVDSVKQIDGGIRWNVGSLQPGDQRSYKINCELNGSGDMELEAGARGQGDLAASGVCLTKVETVADLVLSVQDPKGPLPTGQDVVYEIRIRNRGTRSARDVNLVMQFSEGIEPTRADAIKHKIVPGQVLFAPIAQIDPGQEIKYHVTAQADKNGTHVFRAQLTCADSDAREIAEGTTRFFGDTVETTPNSSSESSTADQSNEFASATEINR